MSLIALVIITWILVMLYIKVATQLRKCESVFLFMFILVINISVSWILIDEMKLIQVPKRLPEYLAYLLVRSVIIPVVVLICLCFLDSGRFLSNKGVTIAAYLTMFYVIEKTAIQYKVFTFTHWKMIYTLIYYLLLLGTAKATLFGYRKVFSRKNEEFKCN
jgi:hypothetical protein